MNSLNVTDSLSIEGELDVTGKIVGELLYVTGKALINNSLDVTGKITGESLDVISAITCDTIAVMSGTIDILDVANAKIESLDVSGKITGESLDVTGKTTMTNTLTLGKTSGTGLVVTSDTHLNGRLGIGTSEPSEKLHVKTTGDTSIYIEAGTENDNAAIYLGTPYNDIGPPKAAIIAEGVSSSSRSKMHFCLNSEPTDASSARANLDNSKMSIDYMGYVGIGTVNPTVKLDVKGNIKATDLILTGDLTINGTLTTIHSTTLSIDDITIELGSVSAPSDTTADGGGIKLHGGDVNDKTLTWIKSTGAWTSNQDVDLLSGKKYKINEHGVLELSSDSNHTILPRGNVGIGTTTPVAKLDVTGDINVSGKINVGPHDASGSGANTILIDTKRYDGWTPVKIEQTYANNYGGNLLFKTHNNNGDLGDNDTPTTKMFIHADGNVGIGTGTTTPSEKLDVNGNINLINNKIINVADPTSNQDVATKAYVDTVSGLGGSGSGVLWKNDVNNYTTGKLGIGTDTPTADLDVEGSIKASSLSVMNGTFDTIHVNNMTLDGDDVATKAYAETVGGRWANDGNNYTTGKLGIGTTGVPTEKLEVNGNVNISGKLNIEPDVGTDATFLIDTKRKSDGWTPVQITQTMCDGYGGNLLFKTRSAGWGGLYGYSAAIIPTTKMFIHANGNVRIGSDETEPSEKLEVDGNIIAKGSITATSNITATGNITAQAVISTSDERLKENIKPIEKTNIQNLDAVEYNFKADKDKKKRYGLIAQQLEKIDESLVHIDVDGTKGINYIDMIALLVKENQNLTKRIEKMEKMLNIQ